MACYLCDHGSEVAHGRMACAWRSLRSATQVRLAEELVAIISTTPPAVERLRLAWWVVRHARAFRGQAALFAGLAHIVVDQHPLAIEAKIDQSTDRADDKRSADKWALLALETVENGL